MKAFTLFIFIIISVNAFAQVKVRGYYRSNGTYVQPHYRSNPDGNPYNNWSFPGNTNPYTGKVATGNPSTYLKNYFDNNERTTTSQTNYSNGSNIIDLLREHISNIKNYSVNVSSLNLRSGPSTSYPVIRSLSFNDNVTVIESYTNGWKKVEYKTYSNLGYSSNIIGFVAGNYISNSNIGVNDFSAIDNSDNFEVFNTKPSIPTPSAPTEIIQPVKPKAYNTSYNYTQPSAQTEIIQPVKPKDYNTSYNYTNTEEVKNHNLENGDLYIGVLTNSKMSGNGTYLWKNGDKYVGLFRDNKINGYGTLTKTNGEKQVGYFVDGTLNGQGSISLKNGISYVGFFKNGLLHGFGSKIYGNGFKEEGYYINGILNATKNTTVSKTSYGFENSKENYTEKVNTPIYNTELEVTKDRGNNKNSDTETKIIAKPKSNEMVNYYGRYLFWTTFYSSYSFIPLREKIDLNAKIIYDCPQNCKVYVIEDLGNLQYKVFINGYTGYISSKFLKPISK